MRIIEIFMSLEDEIMSSLAPTGFLPCSQSLEWKDMPIEHPFISKAIENAQTRVEGLTLRLEKYLLEYDNVMNKRRKQYMACGMSSCEMAMCVTRFSI